MAIYSSSVAVKVSGTATTLTNAATTTVTANTVYQITTAAYRLLDPNTALTVEVDADGAGAGSYATASPSTYTVDYLFGKITFASDQGASALVRVSGKYLPVHTVAEARSVAINSSRDELEDTIFGDADRSRMLGLASAEGEIEGLDMLDTDLDAGGDTLKVSTLHDNGTAKLLEVTLGSVYWRGWVVFPKLSNESKPDALATGKISWRTSSQLTTGESEFTTHGIGS